MVAYIDADYYTNVYKGADAGDDLDRYIERASDLVDQVTGYKIKDFDSLPQFIQDQVKKATAAQVEFYVMQGGDEDVNAGNTDFARVQIGSFGYSTGSERGMITESKAERRVSPATLAYLEPTGLLYRGLGVVHSVY